MPSPYQNNWEQFWPDFWDQNADSKLDDGRLQAKNIALVGMGFRELSQLSTAGYFTNFPAGTYEFRNASAVQVFHRFSQNVYWLGHLIYISNGNENAKEGWESMYNQLWCNFADPANTGTSTRIFFLQYTNPVASYVYSCNTNNNSNETWTYLDDVLFNHQKNWGQSVARRGNAYPSKISLVGTKTWSHINPSVSVTFLGGSMDVIDRSETPSAGHRINPMPEIVVLEPNKWYPPVTTSTGGPDGGST